MIKLVDETNALPDGTLGPDAFEEFAGAIGAEVQWPWLQPEDAPVAVPSPE